jgi:pimeloyl-ACP methyl ester carboxylesterase
MTTDANLDARLFEERHFEGIRYFVGGEGAPVVLLHGLGGLASNWRLVAPGLVGERRVVVPELPGHGGSAPLSGAATLDSFADAMLSVLDAEGIRAAPWVGHSLGGLLALRAAVLRPDAVTGIVLAGAAGITSASRVGEAVVTVLGTVRPGRYVGRHPRLLARTRTGRTLAFWWGVADPAALDPDMAAAFLAGPPQHTDTLTAGRALVATDPRQDLDRVTCPCLCLWGASDRWVPVQDGMEYARRLRAPFRAIADCGHLLVGERPDVVTHAVREFLASLDSEVEPE